MALDSRLKVAILASSARSYGGTSYFSALLPALMDWGKAMDFYVFCEKELFTRFCHGKQADHVRHYPVPTGLAGWRRIAWEQIVLPRILRRLGIHLVYTAVNVGLLWSRIPCVIAVRNMEPLTPCNSSVSWRRRLRHFALEHATRLSVKRARRVVAVSHFVCETLRKGGCSDEKIDVVYHGVDDLSEGPPRDGPEHRTGHVLAVAKFIRYANLETLMRGFAQMRGCGYRGILRFAGGAYDKKYEGEIRDLVLKLG